jgi:hypothetical protein
MVYAEPIYRLAALFARGAKADISALGTKRVTYHIQKYPPKSRLILSIIFLFATCSTHSDAVAYT